MSTRSYPQQQTKEYLTSNQLDTILLGCRLNQRLAQKELYHIYYGYAMSVTLRYSSNYDNAVEMANDAFLKIYRHVKHFVPRYGNTVTSFMAWFKIILVNACIDHVRKYNKKERMANIEIEQVAIADEGETAGQMLQYKQVIKCIQRLSPAYKAVFNLHVIEGFSHVEIAGKLNISEGTSKSNLHKARHHLQELLKEGNMMSYERCV